jgi:methionyl-tRNA synthetase
MTKNKKFYLTTTLPYVNANPHIGFALEIIQADAIVRLHRLLGDEVIFNFGTDEHGLKIYRKALEAGKDPQTYVDEYAAKFDELKKALNLSYTHFIRTTNPDHKSAAQEFWKRCLANGDIYKKKYSVKYCVGCELEKTDSELVDGKCPIHPNMEIELIEEDNYFFAFSKYQEPLLKFYVENPDFVVPEGKFTEIKSFVKEGLQDFSISRLKSKMP